MSIQIFKLAKELGVTVQAIQSILDIEGVKNLNYSSPVSDQIADKIRSYFQPKERKKPKRMGKTGSQNPMRTK